MCGIVGYVGSKQAAPILLEGLSRLEYRGYDSAGIAVQSGAGVPPTVVKAKGRLKILATKTDNGRTVPGTCGIGHTRWATHGEPSETNAHPHHSDDYLVTVVHNGIIDNYLELKEWLEREGYTFYSDTDTEVLAKLIDRCYRKGDRTAPLAAISEAMLRLRGSYALGVLFSDRPDTIYAARNESPLIVGAAGDATLIASDVPAILNLTRTVYYLDNHELAELTADSVRFFNAEGQSVDKDAVTITWDAEAAEKGGYEHFMMKEIHEQPKAVRDTISAYVQEGVLDLSSLELPEGLLEDLSELHIVACGSAYHVGAVAKYQIEQLTRVPVNIDLASEFRYRDPIIGERALVVIISQSGETADSLAALRLAKERGVPTLAVVNVVGSSIAREADHVMYTYAGPEIAVATTKAYSTQLVAMDLLAMGLGRAKGLVDEQAEQRLVAALQELPDQIESLLSEKERIQWFASKFAGTQSIFFIGRGLDYAICMEGSLKMKEVSYIHSEAYAAGELKHGTISLIEPGTLVIASLTQRALHPKTLSNATEVKSRGAYLVGVANAGDYDIERTIDFPIYLPKTEQLLTPSLAVVPLQLMAYYTSVNRGIDVDKPRNLAKSVTVE